MTDWTLVGGDPAPGDPVVVRQMAVAFDNTSIRAHDASGAITRLVGQVHAGQIWTGRAALAWVDQAQSLPPDLGKLAASYGEAAAALRTYAGALEGYQSAGRRIAEEAIAAHAELGRAQADVARAQSAASAAARAAAAAHGTRNRVLGEQRALPADADPSMHSSVAARVAQAHNAAQQADSAAAGASSALQTARRAESQADQRLSTARARADAVRYSAQDSGRQVEAALLAASHHGIRNRGFLMRTYQDGIALARYAYTVDNVTAALDLVANTMGTTGTIAAFVPGGQPLAAALLGASAIFSAAAFVGHAKRFSRGKESLSSLGLNAATTALSAFGAVKGVKGVMGAAAQEGRILAAGKAVTAATRPMALRTTTEQFLANAKRVMGGGDARTVSGFMHMQVGVAQTTPLKAGVEMIAMTVSTGVDVLVDAPATAGRIVDAALRGGVTVAPAPDPITVIDKTARTLSEAASSGRR